MLLPYRAGDTARLRGNGVVNSGVVGSGVGGVGSVTEGPIARLLTTWVCISRYVYCVLSMMCMCAGWCACVYVHVCTCV